MKTAQILAADPEASVWVAASAGTGKTKALTSRVLTLLLHGFAPERILCLTFTKAAAAEMANRLTRRLAKWAALVQTDLSGELEELLGHLPSTEQIIRARQLFTLVLDTPGGMKIQTIHGFCQSILGRFPLEAQISPHFRILDENQAKDMWTQAKQSVFQKSLPLVTSALNVLNPHMGDMYFSSLLESFYTYRTRLSQILNEQQTIQDFAQGLLEFLNITTSLTVEDCLSENLIERLQKQFAPQEHNFEDYINIFLTKEGQIRKKIGDDQLFEAEEALRFTQYLKAVDIARRTLAFAVLFLEINQSYQKQKLQSGVLDYEDLIYKTQSLLAQAGVASWILYKLDGGIDHLLIDEAQDTNTTQWQIIQSLTAEFFTPDKPYRTFFAVGDAKQSIYSFQGADPREFLRLKDHFAHLVRNHAQQWREVNLDLSYRSTPAVLKAVDRVFANPENCRGVLFDKGPVTHRAFREHDKGIVEIWPLITECEEEAPEAFTGEWRLPLARTERTSALKRQAGFVASQIARWLEKGEKLPSTNKPVQPRDILILTRKRSDLGHEIIRALEKKAIPVTGADRLNLTGHIAIMDMIALGQFVLLPEDDLTLACVLRSPLVGLGEEDLYILAQGRQGALWTSLVEKACEKPDFTRACEWLKAQMNETAFDSVYEFYSRVLYECQGKSRFLARLGNEVEDILDEFLTLALQHDQSGAGSLQGFIQALTAQAQEIKRDASNTAHNQVRIMTAHGSKGLQAPIVILPDAAETGKGKKDAILWTDNLFLVRPAREDDIPQTRLLKTRSQTQNEEEYRRLLYVALTRAQDQLYVGGYGRDNDSAQGSWYHMLAEALTPKEGQENSEHILDYSLSDTENTSTRFPALAQPLLPVWVTSSPSGSKTEGRFGKAPPASLHLLKTEAMERGNLIHKFFEHLPTLPKQSRYQMACQIIKDKGASLEQFENDINKTLEILEDPAFSDIFGAGAFAEVPVIGFIDEKAFEGRIDRLVITKDMVTIVDYKTGRTPPSNLIAIPQAYKDQLESYEKVLKPLYPTHRFRKLLLWIEGPLLQELVT